MKLEDRIREIMRFKHYSLSTEESYVGGGTRRPPDDDDLRATGAGDAGGNHQSAG
jgi:hypothetical protein